MYCCFNSASGTSTRLHRTCCIFCFALKFCNNALVTILLNVSLLPTGRIPRVLSSPIILHDRKGRIGTLSVFVVASLRVNLTGAPPKSMHQFSKLSEHRTLFAPCAFNPLGPAPPLHFRVTFLMNLPVSSAYRLSGTDSGVPFIRNSGLAGSAGGCFFQRVDNFWNQF